LASVQVSSVSGAAENLVRVTDEGAVLVCGHQYVYSIAGGAVTRIDAKTGTGAALAASAGTLPVGVTVGAIYRDRLFLGGADNAIYSSAMGDHTNWDRSVDVSRSTRALPPFQLSPGAEVGPVPTALVPFGDAMMLLATANTLWSMRGDPGAKGSLIQASRHVGILGPRAWCRVEQQAVFLSGDGLYICGGDGGRVTNISGERLPEDLRGIDPAVSEILLGYDHDANGVHVYVSGSTHWFFHLPTETFWPMALQAGHEPSSLCVFDGDLILGCSDGELRSVGGDDDDGETIESHVLVGPVRIWTSQEFGRLMGLYGTMAASTADVTWRLVVGHTAEEAAENAKAAVILYQAADAGYEAYVFSSGTWTAGRAHVVYPRCRAVWVVLWLQSEGKWAYENVTLDTAPSARWR